MMVVSRIQYWLLRFFILCFITTLVACGGGGSSDKGTAPISSVPTAVSSSSSLSNAASSAPAEVISLFEAESSLGSSSLTNNSTSSNSSANGLYLRGGTIQGVPLNLTTQVTDFQGNPWPVNFKFGRPTSFASDGTYFYVTDALYHNIRRVVIATGEVSTIAGFKDYVGSTDGVGQAVRFNMPKGIATDGTNLYVADTGNSTIRKIIIATGVVSTFAGVAGANGSADGVGAIARFYYPTSITTDGTNLYVADTNNHTVRKIVIATLEVTTFAGNAGTAGAVDGIGEGVSFNLPGGIVAEGANLYVTDTANSTIRKVVIGTGEVSTIAGQATIAGYADGAGSEARFNYPEGIVTDGVSLYVADTLNEKVRVIAIGTGAVTTYLASGVFKVIGTDGVNLLLAGGQNIYRSNITTKVIQLYAGGSGHPPGNYYTDITTDGTNLYVYDNTRGAHLAKIDLSTGYNSWLGSFGGNGVHYTNLDASYTIGGITAAAEFLYVSQPNRGCTWGSTHVKRFGSFYGETEKFFGACGTPGFIDGIGDVVRFNSPTAITNDGSNLYVADSYTIRKIVIATGRVWTLAGKVDTAGNADGKRAEARFSEIGSMTTDGVNLYVADSGNHVIRKVVIATGVVSTIAGGVGASGSDDGTGAVARFNFPKGITTDGTNLYVADSGNATVRKIAIATGEVTTLAGNPNFPPSFFNSYEDFGQAARFGRLWGITSDGSSLYVLHTGSVSFHQISKIR